MGKKGLFIFYTALYFLFFFLLITASCIGNQKNYREKNELPEAYWNQEEHDKAIHKIHQPRNLLLTVSVKHSDAIFSDKVIRIYTGSQKYGSKDEYTDITLGENGSIAQKIHYNHSFIGIELRPSILDMENGIDTAFFSWYRPDTWVKELSVDIDITHFSSVVYPSSDKGLVKSEIFFHPEWKEKKTWVCFENLFALTSTPEEHPNGLSATEAEIKRNKQGIITIILNMPGFFSKWNKNYEHPWEEGDLYPVSLSLTLTPPAGFFRTTLSDKHDPPFVPKKYKGRVKVSDGDPYLFVPSTDPLEEAIIEVNVKVPVTSVMLK